MSTRIKGKKTHKLRINTLVSIILQPHNTPCITPSRPLLGYIIHEQQSQFLLKSNFFLLSFLQAIVGFRETERKHWNSGNLLIIERLRARSFEPGQKLLPYVHVLDLNEEGHIKPHIDSARVSIIRSILCSIRFMSGYQVDYSILMNAIHVDAGSFYTTKKITISRCVFSTCTFWYFQPLISIAGFE